jgi:GWxTD domain-containing protein
LEEDVVYIITPEEKSVFTKLSTPEEKDAFIEQFWSRRDPDPATSANEFKEEHYRRLQYVNERFASGI